MGFFLRFYAMSFVFSVVCRFGIYGVFFCFRRMIRVGWKNEILFIVLKIGK